MIRGRLLARLAGVSLLCVSTGAFAEERPLYFKRLELPIVEDAIGYPRAVTADPRTGEVFVSDTRKNRILIFDTDGFYRHEIEGGAVFSAPTDLAVDSQGFLFVLANHESRRTLIQLDFDGLFLREIVPSGLPGDREAPALLSLAITADGERLFALDEKNYVVWILERDGGVRGAIDLGPGLDEQHKREIIPGKVDVYGDRVLVAESSARKIHIFDLDGNPVADVGASGTSPCKLGFPTAAALDAAGNLLIIDQQRMVILRWDPRRNRCLGDYYGLGSAPGFLYYPLDIALDRAGQAYVTQGYEGRVQMYRGLPAAAAPAAVEQAADADPRAVVEAALRVWLAARAEGRADDDVAAYSADYRPWGFADHAAWESFRRSRWEHRAPRAVEISELQIEPLGPHTARVAFVEQDLPADSGERRRKTLVFTRERGAWKIIEERTAEVP